MGESKNKQIIKLDESKIYVTLFYDLCHNVWIDQWMKNFMCMQTRFH